MAITDVAIAAYNVFPMDTIQTPYGSFPLPVVMTAIAGAEDSFRNGPGDYHTPDIPSAWCNGYGSFGAWQINLYYNGDEVAQLSGIPKSNPCGQANWLMASYTNCAKVAYAAYRGRGGGLEGFKDWCTWWGDGLCGTKGGQPGYGPYHQYLGQAQIAVNNVIGNNGTIPTLPANAAGAPKWLLWLGLAGAGVGAVILGWQWSKREPVTGFARRRDETHMDARVDPKWMTYISVTEKDAAEIARPLSACDVYANLKAASERRGVPWLEDRNLPAGVEAVYTPPEPRFPKGKVMFGTHVTRQAEKCMPYGVQTALHEEGHSVLHHPGCLPNYRGVSYSSENHQVEEQEVELGSFAAMVELGLPVETYEGTVYPAGTEEIDWGLAKRNLDPDTYENVRWLTDVLVRAGQGDVDALANATCPFARKGA